MDGSTNSGPDWEFRSPSDLVFSLFGSKFKSKTRNIRHTGPRPVSGVSNIQKQTFYYHLPRLGL